MNDKTEQSLAASPEPAVRQFQDRDGGWHDFIDERHFRNTVANGSWPIRNLYTQEAIDNLRAQLAEAQRDAERLDWIIEHRAYVVSDPDCCDGYWLNYARPDGTMWTQATEHETPRAAIDAAKGPA